MNDLERLTPGRFVDVTTRSTPRRWWHPEPTVNALLARFSCWRVGRSDGRRALLHIVPPYRQIVLWPRAKR